MNRLAIAFAAGLGLGLAGASAGCGADPCEVVCERGRSCPEASGVDDATDCAQRCESSRAAADAASCLDKHDDYFLCVEDTGDVCAFLEALGSEEGPPACVTEVFAYGNLCMFTLTPGGV